ncbi:peripheral myelin protein 22-like isoform X1 [Lampetra fluviatilis]
MGDRRATMFLLLLFVIFLHIVPIVLLFVSTIDSSWWVAESNVTDLWYSCHIYKEEWKCNDINYKNEDAEWIQAVQALMILSVIFCCCAFFAFVCQLFTLKKGGRFFITGVLQLLACACVLTAASIYVGWFQPQHLPSSGPGYSYILAWVAFPLTFLSGIIYCFLRKKE